MAKLWGGRFTKDSNSLLDEFNASILFDRELWEEDINGSRVHARMLNKIGVLSDSELESIENGLSKIADEISNGEFEFKLSDEDIHMAIESRLISIIGDIGKKLHTARSRNDQVALDFRLYVLKNNKIIRGKILNLIEAILDIAQNHTSTIMPGMTHLQHAQPINFGFALIAWCMNLKRDFERFTHSYTRNNFSPLGSGALAGVPYDNNREYTSRELGFSEPSWNAMDSVSDRDFALDILYDISMLFMHISRFSEELILWSSSEFGFISFSDEYSTGSSIMPQKKNPDVAELLRGKSGRTFGNLIGLFSVMKGLPFAYNKDTQEDKESVFDSVKTALISLEILKNALCSMEVNADNMKKMAHIGHLSATDLADFLVKECGIAFRDAHHITGRVVMLAECKGVDISMLSEEEILSVDERIKKGVGSVLNLDSSMNSRDSYGGTSQRRTLEQISKVRQWIGENR